MTFKERYKEVDCELRALELHMLPENNRTQEEIAEASIYYHKACVKRWEIRRDELSLIKWTKEQK